MFAKNTLILNAILSVVFMTIIIGTFNIFAKTPLESKEIAFLFFIAFLVSFLGSIIDIFRYRKLVAKLKIKNEELQLEKDYSQSINEMVPAGMFVTDKNYVITTWNTQAEKITGYKKENVLGKNYLEIAKQIFGKQCSLPNDNVYKGRDLICREYLINTNDNNVKFIKKDSKLIRDINGEIEGMVGSFYDMTQQKLFEGELLELQDKLGVYLDKAKLIFLILNPERKVSMINEKGAEILGYSKQEVLNRDWFDFVPEKIRPRVLDTFNDNILGEVEFAEYYENEVEKKDGTVITVGWNNSIIKNDKNEIEGMLSVGIDLTDQKQFEELLRYQATIDDMTKMYNRRTGLEMLRKQHSLSRRYHRKFTICFIDLDRLKYVNDNIGHDAGDEYIIKVSELIHLSIRDADIACRLGGDEFLIIFPESGSEAAKTVVERITLELEKVNDIVKECKYSISYGFSMFDGNSEKDVDKDMTKMISEADREMYKMKEKHVKSENTKRVR